MNDPFNEFLTNHWPHMVSRVARLEGMVAVGLGLGAALVGLVATIVVLAVRAS